MLIKGKVQTKEREAYFLDYVRKARKLLTTPLMLTGGFRTVTVMESAIASGALDVIGIARPFTLYPALPNLIFERKIETINIPKLKTGMKALDRSGFIEIKWHEAQIQRLGEGKKPNPNLSVYSVIGQNLVETFKKLIIGNSRSRGVN